MKLKDYLTENGIKPAAFACAIGRSVRSVQYYIKGRVPERVVMDKIREVTGGCVTANDFYHGAAQ